MHCVCGHTNMQLLSGAIISDAALPRYERLLSCWKARKSAVVLMDRSPRSHVIALPPASPRVFRSLEARGSPEKSKRSLSSPPPLTPFPARATEEDETEIDGGVPGLMDELLQPLLGLKKTNEVMTRHQGRVLVCVCVGACVHVFIPHLVLTHGFPRRPWRASDCNLFRPHGGMRQVSLLKRVSAVSLTRGRPVS